MMHATGYNAIFLQVMGGGRKCLVKDCPTGNNYDGQTNVFLIPSVLKHDPEITTARRKEWMIRLNLTENGFNQKSSGVCAKHFLSGITPLTTS